MLIQVIVDTNDDNWSLFIDLFNAISLNLHFYVIFVHFLAFVKLNRSYDNKLIITWQFSNKFSWISFHTGAFKKLLLFFFHFWNFYQWVMKWSGVIGCNLWWNMLWNWKITSMGGFFSLQGRHQIHHALLLNPYTRW